MMVFLRLYSMPPKPRKKAAAKDGEQGNDDPPTPAQNPKQAKPRAQPGEFHRLSVMVC
jgi:hypothetical protein